MEQKPTVMTIAGSDSGGGAGIAADLKTFAALGVHGTCAITSVTAQNTKGVLDAFNLTPAAISSQIEAVCEDMEIKWVKTGMLASSDIIREVASQIKKHSLSLVLDPVMAAEAGGDLLRKDALTVLIGELLPLSEVITPNIFEAEALSGIPVRNLEDAKIAAQKIAEKGAKAVIVTGGHLEGSDLVYDSVTGNFTLVSGTFVKGGTHGSGCTYSAATAAYLAKGAGLEEAAKAAKKFVEQAIQKSMPVGKGVSPVNQLGQVLEEKERYLTLTNTMKAVSVLEASPEFAKLIPEVGSNIGMAIPDAKKFEDVAALEWRIIRYRGRAHPVGCVIFGASQHVARIILAALRNDPEIRAAVIIKYSEKVLEACRELNLSISSFDRTEEPDHISTMDWGTSRAITAYGRVPDVVFDKGGTGKEPMVRILGKSAEQVAEIAVELAKRIY